MKRVVIVLFLLTGIVALGFYIWSDQNENKAFYSNIEEFNQLLINEQFLEAKRLYDESNDTQKANYNLCLNTYIDNFVYNLENETSAQSALDKIYEFKTIGYSNELINGTLIHYEDLLQSNCSFAFGLEYYEDHDYENAIACLRDVKEYDKNYEEAQNLIDKYTSKNYAFKDAYENNKYGRSPYPNSVAYKDGFIYLPIEINNTYCLLKIDENNNTSTLFPIASTKDSCIISSVNVIGEYIYFIFGENTGSGKLLQSPYPIYEMKIDGTGLKKVKDGDFFDLMFYKDKFYALSYTRGLLVMDSAFINEEIISNELVIQMQPNEDGIYYTTKDANVYDSIHTFYFYDGENHTKNNTQPTVNTSVYDDGNLICFSKEGLNETLYFMDKSNGGPQVNYITSSNILNVYGKLDDTVIYSTSGKFGQEVVYLHSLKKHKTFYHSLNDQLFEYKILGVCNETESIILSSASSISIADSSLKVTTTIPFPFVNNTTLEENQNKVTLMKDEELYSQTEKIVKEDDFWYYSNNELNIRVEKKFLDELECYVYVAHIRTLNPDVFKIAYSEEPLPSETKRIKSSDIAINNSAIWAINSDHFYNKQNSGVVIRNGNLINSDMDKDILAFYSDGSLLTHRNTFGVNIEQLLEDGVINTFSYGPILIEDGLITYDCFTSNLFEENLRSAIGMVNPNHYVTIVSDGNRGYESKGLTLYTLAKLFIDEGCSIAYNFEGGDAASAIFMGDYINYYNEEATDKEVSEICYFGESSTVK